MTAIARIKLIIKPGKVLPTIKDHVWGNFVDGVYREFTIVSISDVKWTSRLLLEVTYKVRVTEHKSKLERRKGLKIIK